MVKAHTPINWENEPSYNTPINEANLNKMDSTIGILDDRIITLDVEKLDKTTANNMVKSISLDESTGIFTITYLNGSTAKIDTKLEKIAINFGYNPETQKIALELIDGTTQEIDLSALITQLEFVDTDTIGWEVTTDGKVRAIVLDGSITEDKLQPNYLAEIKVESGKAEANATKSQSYAVGGTNTRENEEIDNAKYYYEQSKSISEGFSGALIPMGTVAFENLPPLEDAVSGWMYNISNEFTTTDDFKEGAGYAIPLGANVFKTSDGFWDVLAGSPVTGVKGVNEETYRRGNIDLSAQDVNAVEIGGDTAENIVSFTSQDSTDVSSWSDVEILTTQEKHSSILKKISTMFKNARYLYKMLGNTDISKIGDGTVTGGLSTLNSNLGNTFNTNDVVAFNFVPSWTQSATVGSVTYCRFGKLKCLYFDITATESHWGCGFKLDDKCDTPTNGVLISNLAAQSNTTYTAFGKISIGSKNVICQANAGYTTLPVSAKFIGYILYV